MNPVDHPHGVRISWVVKIEDNALTTDRVVTINILVRHQQSRDTLHKVKRLVLLPPEELVCCVVPRRSRIKWGWVELRFFICLGHDGFAFLVPFGRSIARNEQKTSTMINNLLSCMMCWCFVISHFRMTVSLAASDCEEGQLVRGSDPYQVRNIQNSICRNEGNVIISIVTLPYLRLSRQL
jgi:hypothetical protein